MTDDAYAELAALRKRLADLEEMAAQAARKEPMYHSEGPTGDFAEKKARRRQEEAAARWTEDAAMEQLAKWRDAGDRRYDQASVGLKAQLGYYLNDKRAAKGGSR